MPQRVHDVIHHAFACLHAHVLLRRIIQRVHFQFGEQTLEIVLLPVQRLDLQPLQSLGGSDSPTRCFNLVMRFVYDSMTMSTARQFSSSTRPVSSSTVLRRISMVISVISGAMRSRFRSEQRQHEIRQ